MNVKQPPSVWIALLVVQALFAVNYVVTKVILGSFPPLVWASMRITCAAALMVLSAILMRKPHPKAEWKYFGPMLLFATFGTIINQGAFQIGLHFTTATNSAVLNTMIPLFTLLIVTLRGQETLQWQKIAGFVVGLSGVLVLRGVENFKLSDQTLIGDLLMLVNCLSYAIFLSISKKFMESHDAVWTTAWLFIYGSVGIGLLSIPDWKGFVFPTWTPQLIWAAIYVIFGSTLLAYFLNSWALGKTRSSQVALFIYIQPVITSAIAYFYMGETITLRTAVAIAAIFSGMLLALSGQRGT